MELRQNIVTEMERNFGKEKLSWQKDEEGLTRSKIDAEIALAKMDWARVGRGLREDGLGLSCSNNNININNNIINDNDNDSGS